MASPRKQLQEQPVAWVLLLVIYVVLGITLKSVVLNWIIGPLFPLIGLYLVPRLFKREAGDAGNAG